MLRAPPPFLASQEGGGGPAQGGSFHGAALIFEGAAVARFEVRGFVWILLGLAVLASAYYALAYYLITN